MFNLVIRVVLTALTLLLITYIPYIGISIDSFQTALIAAVVLGILNVLVKPVLFILTLPITILTLGLFSFVVNAAVFALAAYFVSGFAIAGFGAALLGSLIVTAVSTVTHHIFA